MLTEIQTTVSNCGKFAKARGTIRKNRKGMELFPESGTLEFVAIDILGPLPVTKLGNGLVLVMNDRLPKLKRSIPMETTTALKVAEQFEDQWIIPYGAPQYLLSDNDRQLVVKLFEAI